MADLVFRSTTRGGRDFFEVTDDGMAYGGKDRYNIKTDGSMNFADTVDEVLAELVFDGAWRINYDKIEVDELGIGDEYKEIVKLIRKKYNWLYNLPKGSKGRQFYFDIGRYFRQELKKGTDYGKIFDKIDSVIEKNNNFEESKKMNKKSIKESYEYEDIKNETPIIDVWSNSEGTHVYKVYKIKSDYIYYEYDYRKHDATLITDDNEIEIITKLMSYLPTKFIVKQEDNIGILNSAITNIKAINKHYGKLKKYNVDYYWQVLRFIDNSMKKDDEPDASVYFDEIDTTINNALEKDGDDFRV